MLPPSTDCPPRKRGTAGSSIREERARDPRERLLPSSAPRSRRALRANRCRWPVQSVPLCAAPAALAAAGTAESAGRRRAAWRRGRTPSRRLPFLPRY
eukprot:scaffold52813_cov41-Tisochrysis_lutea.AAC.1